MDLFLYFFKAYPKRTILVFLTVTLASVITAVTLLALPALLAAMIGRTTGKAEFFNNFFLQIGINPTTENLLVFLLSGIILQNLLLGSAKIYAGFTVAKIVKDFRIKLLKSMSRTEWSYFIKQSSGGFTSALVYEINRAGNGYITFVEILAVTVQVIAYLSIAFLISWQIAVIAIVSSLILVILFGKIIKLSKQLGHADVLLIRQITAHLTDSYRSIKALKAMARESHSHAALSSYAKELKTVSKKSTIVSESLNMIQEIVLMSTVILTVYFAFDFLNIPIEYAIILVILYLRSMKLFAKGQKQYQNFVINISGFREVMSTLDGIKANQEVRNGRIKHELKGDIEFNKVSFRHMRNKIFKKANATFHHRKLNTVIGVSGAGKSTLVDLICGLFTPSYGFILVDGIKLADLDIKHWRNQIGYVTQENNLLNTTIEENVTLGDQNYAREQVMKAIKNAHADTFIAKLPEGLDTVVGENGVNLSGGQRQRILIARALVHSPSLLILDEATSALDIETEKSLSLLFKELSKKITIISISHRPAMIDVSDYVYELIDGKLHDKCDFELAGNNCEA